MTNMKEGGENMENPHNEEILAYTTLQLESLKRELTPEELAKQEEIRGRLQLPHEEILEQGKKLLLS